MKKHNKEQKSPKYCIKVVFCSIFFISVFSLFSCAQMQSVRNGNDKYAPKQKALKEQNLPSPNQGENIKKSPSANITQKNEIKSDNPKEDYIDKSKRLPTLREQLSDLETRQTQNEKRMNALESKIDSMKAENRSVLNDIKSNIIAMKNADGSERIAQKGGYENAKSSKDLALVGDGGIILSDQEYSKSAVKKEVKKSAAVESIQSATPKTKISAKKSTKQKSAKTKKTNKSVKKKDIAQIEKKTEDNKLRDKSVKEEKKAKEERIGGNDKLFTDNNLSAAIDNIQNRQYSDALKKLTASEAGIKDATALSEVDFYYGEAYMGLKNYPKAVQYYQKSLKCKSGAKQMKAQARLAEALYKSGQNENAKQAYEKLLNKYPKSEYAAVAKKMLQQL